jgi:OHCU decarboxylase
LTGLERLNGLPAVEAAVLLASCCGAAVWVERMLARRPFESEPAALEAADEVFASLSPEDWREAFRAHPRIGDRDARGEAAAEQAGTTTAPASILAGLLEANRAYEARFGHLFIVFASGRSAGEMLDLCRRRLHNEPEVELSVAAEEQRKITRLRLQRLLNR